MKIVMIRVNIVKDKKATLTRFLNGMNREICNMVELKHYIELEYMVHLAIKAERQLKRIGNARQGGNLDFFFQLGG
jgi:hypothetical protein